MRKRALSKSVAFGGAALLAVGIIALVAFGQTIKWVGRTDLEMRFVVTDASTGKPVSNATVHVRAEPGGYCDDRVAREFTVTTDNHGHATQLCTNCMCFGSKGLFEDTFAAHLPSWWFHVTAVGYLGTKPAFLDELKNARLIQRGRPSATISVPIPLQKTAA